MPDSDTIQTVALQLLEKLISFDSVSSNSNLPVIEFIEGYLKQHDVEYTRAPSPDGKKSNLLARIGAAAEGGIVLSGHTDVVPVAGQSWDSDPFTLTAKDSRLYGRGTADMKSFIAICLAMVPTFKQANLEKPIWLAFSYDEEVGCLGAPVLLDYMSANIPRPAFVIIGEPTMMQLVTAHKGVLPFETKVHGFEWHSSQPNLGVNAVHYACELVQASDLAFFVHPDYRGGTAALRLVDGYRAWAHSIGAEPSIGLNTGVQPERTARLLAALGADQTGTIWTWGTH